MAHPIVNLNPLYSWIPRVMQYCLPFKSIVLQVKYYKTSLASRNEGWKCVTLEDDVGNNIWIDQVIHRPK